MPDYNASQRNFHFLHEAFTKHQSNNFIVQSFNPEQYSIRTACKLNKNEFIEFDHKFRKENNYPPFSDLCIILYKHEIEDRLFTSVDKLRKELLFLKEKY